MPSPLNTFSETLTRELSTPPPSHLFHYTSAEGLLGILKGKKVWATNLSFLNDAKEFEHAIEVTKTELTHRAEGAMDELEQEFIGRALMWANMFTPKEHYVFAMSKDPDLLSQWRAYCPPGGGFAIGFPTEQLQRMAQRQEFILAPCVYEPDKQQKIVMKLSRHFFEMLECKFQAVTGGAMQLIGRERSASRM